MKNYIVIAKVSVIMEVEAANPNAAKRAAKLALKVMHEVDEPFAFDLLANNRVYAVSNPTIDTSDAEISILTATSSVPCSAKGDKP